MNKVKPLVSIERCSHYNLNTVSEVLQRILEPHGGIGAFVKRGERVLLKPNLLKAAAPAKAVTTHPVVVEAVVRALQSVGGIAVIGDSPGIGKIQKIFDETGMTRVAERTGAELIELGDSTEVEMPEGATFRTLEISKEVLDADKVINLPKVKTHAQMYVTFGVKNCFGCVVGKRKPQWHFKAGVTREYFAELILDIYSIVSPVLTIADGILAMEGNGPGGGDPRHVGLLFASTEALAMDRVITEVLGLDPGEVPLFRAAEKRGLKGTALEEIEIAGSPIAEVRVERFVPAQVVDMMFGPSFLRRYFKDAVTAKPKIDHEKCTLCMDCTRVCPTEVMSAKDKKIDIFYRDCIHCFCCQEICPEGAITPKQGWLLRLLGGRG